MNRFLLLRFFLVLALGFNNSLVLAEEESAGGSVIDEAKETVAEAVEHATEAAENVADAVQEEAAKVAEEAAKVAENVAEKVADAIPDEVTKEVPAETSGSSVVEGLKDKIKSLVDKVKSLDKPTMKKIAAGAIGVWGVSLAVGWLTKGSGSPAPDVAAPQKKRR